MNTDDRELLTAREVAEQMKVSERTLHSWRKSGYGPPAIKLRAGFRYSRADLDQWLEQQREAHGGRQRRSRLGR